MVECWHAVPLDLWNERKVASTAAQLVPGEAVALGSESLQARVGPPVSKRDRASASASDASSTPRGSPPAGLAGSRSMRETPTCVVTTGDEPVGHEAVEQGTERPLRLHRQGSSGRAGVCGDGADWQDAAIRVSRFATRLRHDRRGVPARVVTRRIAGLPRGVEPEGRCAKVHAER